MDEPFKSYENLLDETKVFLNKAMDIYAVIKDRKMENFSNLDKRILSLLAASFLVEGELKVCLINYDQLKLDDVLRFMDLNEEDIKPYDGDYASFYEANFQEDLESMNMLNCDKAELDKTPIVIFSYFNPVLVLSSNILNRLAKFSKLPKDIFRENDFFQAIDGYVLSKRKESIPEFSNFVDRSFDSYDDLSEETKIFLNRAMDIYDVLVGKLNDFSYSDEVVLSIFAATYMINGPLRELVEKYSGLKFDDVLRFMDITKEEIKPLSTDRYAKYYSIHFEQYFKEVADSHILDDFPKTPIVIFSYFNQELVNGSNILNKLSKYCGLENTNFKDNAINIVVKLLAGAQKNKKKNASFLNAWDNYKSIDGLPENRDSLLGKARDIRDDFYGGIGSISPRRVPAFKDSNKMLDKDLDGIGNDNEEELKKRELEYFESDEIWDILEDIKRKFIGQEDAVEDLFYNIVNNQRMVLQGNIQDGERSIMFVDGPTGTGKTAIITEITNRLNIPFHRSSSTTYSPTGYVGEDITITLRSLMKMTNNDIAKAERGIIVFDEFDKLVYNQADGNSLDIKKAVQQQLLDFMGGGSYKVPIMQSMFGSIMGDFDTRNLTFICLGALSSLRDKKSTPEKSIGFNADYESKIESYEITPQDLINLGYERELVGRINTYLHTEEYSKEALEKILRESSISPMLGFKKWIESYNKKLIIEEEVYEVIAEEAYKLNTGARSLQTVLNNTRTLFLKQVMRSREDTIYLDCESVRMACRNFVTRKSRI